MQELNRCLSCVEPCTYQIRMRHKKKDVTLATGVLAIVTPKKEVLNRIYAVLLHSA